MFPLDQEQRALEKSFMGFSGDTAGLHGEARECVNKCDEAAARRLHMSNHVNYVADPHLSSQYLSHAVHVKSYNMVDTVDRHTTARQFEGSNPMIGLSSNTISSHLVFEAAAKRNSPWSGDGTGGRQQFLCFNGPQEQIRHDKVSDNHQFTHVGGLANGYAVPGSHTHSVALDSALEDLPRSKLKMFPFMVPALREPSLLKTEQQVVTTGDLFPARPACMPSSPSSPRVLSSDSCTKSSVRQLTIFYKGQVNVYNNVSSIKVQDIMLMAAACDSSPEYLDLNTRKSASHVNVECGKLPHMIDLNTSEPDESEATRPGAHLTPIRISMQLKEEQADSSMVGFNNMQLVEAEAEPVVPQALPQARKASLTRFLERRKERLMAGYPYCVERSVS